VFQRVLGLGLFLAVTLPSASSAVPTISTPSTLAFGNVIVNSSGDQSLTIQNTGNQTLTVNSLGITAGGTQYALVSPPTPPVNIAPGNSISVTVRLFPTSRGPKAGTIAIGSNDPATPTKTVSLSGAGVAPVISAPLSVNYGNVRVGTASNLNVQVSNTSTDVGQVLTLSDLAISGAEFSIPSLPPSLNINPGAVLNVAVRFAPTSRGAKSATLTILSNDPLNPTKTVSLGGVGVAPIIATSTPSLDFGNRAVSSVSDLSLFVENVGDAGQSLIVSSVGISGSSAFLVQSTPPLPAFVAAGGSISVTVRFAPDTEGPHSGSLAIASNDPFTPMKTVTLQGAALGPLITTSSETIDFGEVAVASSSPEFPLVIGNDAPVDADLQVSAVTIAGPDASSFGLLDPPALPIVVHRGEFSDPFPVVFTPQSAGPKHAVLEIASNDASTPMKAIALQGVGTGTVGVVSGPFALALSGAKPNPAPGRAQFDFTLPEPGAATLTVFDVHGRRIAMVASGARAAGPHSVRWEGRDELGRPAPAGIYFARLVAARKAIVKRFAVVR
jgi:hypothetical protein